MSISNPAIGLFSNLSGVARLDALADLAWEKRTEDSGFSKEIVAYLLRLCEARQYVCGEASALTTRALLGWLEGELQSALVDGTRSRYLALECDDSRLLARCDTVLGLVQWNLGLVDDAWESWREGYFIFQRLGDSSGMANSMTNFANLLFEDGQFERAEEYCEEALLLMEKEGNLMGVGNLQNNIGCMSLKREAYTKARSCFRKAALNMKRIGNWFALVSIYENLAELCIDRGDPNEARRFLALTRRYQERVGMDAEDQRVSIQTVRYLSHAKSREQDLSRALEIGQWLLNTSLRDVQEATLLKCMVELCTTMGRLEEALDYCGRLTQHWEDRCMRSSRNFLRRAEKSFRLSRSSDGYLHRGFVGKEPKQVLSEREYEVFLCLGRGMISREIGEHLNISPQTVQVHRRRIARKLDTQGTELSVAAVKYFNDLHYSASSDK